MCIYCAPILYSTRSNPDYPGTQIKTKKIIIIFEVRKFLKFAQRHRAWNLICVLKFDLLLLSDRITTGALWYGENGVDERYWVPLSCWEIIKINYGLARLTKAGRTYTDARVRSGVPDINRWCHARDARNVINVLRDIYFCKKYSSAFWERDYIKKKQRTFYYRIKQKFEIHIEIYWNVLKIYIYSHT